MGSAYEVIGNAARDRRAWLRARRDGLGASDCAAVLGVSPWSSALEVYAEKVSGEIREEDPSVYATWGKILEPHLIAQFAERTGRAVRREGRLLRSRRHPWQMATLDARQRRRPKGPPGLVEIKTTKFNWDRLPEDIYAQVQHQFAVTRMRYGSIVVFNRTSCETEIVPVEPDPDYIGELTEIEADFWSNLEKGIPPEPDGSESAARTLRRIYPKHVPGKEIMLDSDLIDVGLALEQAKQSKKGIEGEIREYESKLIAAIGEAEIGLLPGGTAYTYRLQQRAGFIAKATEFRVLRRKEARA